MSPEGLKFSWNSFSEQLYENRKNLLEEKLFTDVTLVSEDLIPIEAHKTILSTASPVFKKLLLIDNISSKPIIFLKNLRHKMLVSLLNFIYIGDVTLCKDEVQNFIEIGKDFDIKEFEFHERQGTEFEEFTKEEEFEMKIGYTKEGATSENKDDSKTFASHSKIKIEPLSFCHNKKEFISDDNDAQNQETLSQYRYSCKKCDRSFGNKFHLKEHIIVGHEKSNYECSKCGRSYASRQGRHRHMNTAHPNYKSQEIFLSAGDS